MIKRKKESLDVENLNQVIDLGRKILKVLYVTIILASVLLAIVLITRLHIGKAIIGVLGVVAPLFIGFVIAWLLNPAVKYLTKKNVNRSLASVFVFAMFLVIVFLIIKFMIPMFYRQIYEFVEIVPSLFTHASNFAKDVFTKLSSTGFDFSDIETKVYEALQSFGKDLATSLPSTIIGGVSSFVSSVGTLLLSLIVGFYLLIDFDGMKKVFNLVPKKHSKDVAKLVADLDDTCKDFIQGTLLIALIVAIITSVLFAIAGLPSPMLLGLICGITNIIPYIGPWVGGAFAAIVGFTVSPLTGIFAIVIAFVSQQIDGMLLQPLIMGKTMKLHPVTIMIGLLVFGYFFGIVGMIIATPVIACIKVLIIFFNKKYKIKEKIVNADFSEENV
jgi:predicted PurR-regulated permease PerM